MSQSVLLINDMPTVLLADLIFLAGGDQAEVAAGFL